MKLYSRLLGWIGIVTKSCVSPQVEAVKWFRKAAERNEASAQASLGACYAKGQGVVKDYVEAYKWFLLAAGQGDENAKKLVSLQEHMMSREQTAEGQKLTRNFKPREVPSSGGDR